MTDMQVVALIVGAILVVISLASIVRQLSSSEQDLNGYLKWMRDHFGRWLASTTYLTFLWVAVGAAVTVAYFWDAIWSGRQAPEGLELSFQAGGAVVRTWTVFALVGAVALFRTGAPKLASILLATWLCTSIMSYGHVLGFVASGQMERYASGQAVEEVANIQTVSVEERISLLATQKKSIEDRLATQVENLNAEIERIYNDRIDNDDLADPLIARRAELQDAANAQIAELDAAKLALLTEGENKAVGAEEAKVTAVKFDPLYIWLADALHDEPTDDHKRTIAARVGAFWALLIELIAGAGPAILYAAHAHFSDKRAKEPKTLNDEQWDLWTTYLKRRNAQLKTDEEKEEEAELRKKKSGLPNDSGFTQRDYWQNAIRESLESAVDLSAIRNYYFPDKSEGELRSELYGALKKGWIDQHQYDDLLDPNRRERRIAERKAAKEKEDSAWIRQRDDDTSASVVGHGDKLNSVNKDGDDGSTSPASTVS